MRTFWHGFFWGPSSHRRVAWLGTTVGLLVLALALPLALLGQDGHPLLLLALLAVGLAELGWSIEGLPRHYVTLAGWGHAVRWSCAVIGFVLAVTGLLGQQVPPWFAGVLAVGALLLVAEMAPSEYANRP